MIRPRHNITLIVHCPHFICHDCQRHHLRHHHHHHQGHLDQVLHKSWSGNVVWISGEPQSLRQSASTPRPHLTSSPPSVNVVQKHKFWDESLCVTWKWKKSTECNKNPPEVLKCHEQSGSHSPSSQEGRYTNRNCRLSPEWWRGTVTTL